MTEEQKKKVEKILNESIANSLAGPVGDPDTTHLWAAFYAYKALKVMNLKVKNEKWIIESLSPKGNIHEEDFLKWLDK